MNKLFLLAALLMLVGCSSNGGDQSEVIVVDLSVEPKSIHEVGLITDCNIVQLQTDSMSVVGNVDKVLKTADRLFIADFRRQYVYVYDTQGRFISKINSIGRGPLEYTQLTEMFVDKDNLYLLSRVDKKLLVYDHNGKFEQKKDMPKTFISLIKTKKGFVGFNGNYIEDKNEPYNVWVMDDDLNIVEKYFEISPSWESKTIGSVEPFSIAEDGVNYIAPVDNSIYLVDNKARVSTPFKFDFGTNNWPSPGCSYDEQRKIIKEMPHSYVSGFSNFQQTPRHLLAYFIFAGQGRVYVYDRVSKQGDLCQLAPYEDKYFMSFGRIVGFAETEIITVIDARQMKASREGKNAYNDFTQKYPQQIARMQKELSPINDSDNPFVIIYSMD